MIYEGKQTVFNHSEQYSLRRLIENEDENNMKKNEEGKSSFSLKLAKYLSTSGVGDLLDLFNVILSLAMSILHCIDTYYYPDEIDTIQIMAMVFNIYFIFDYLLNIYVAENKLLFAFYTSSMLEYVSILPSFLARLGVIEGNQYIYLTRILRFLAVRKLDKILARHSMEVTRHIFKVSFTLTSILIINASFLLVVEKVATGNRYGILDYLYFMVVTVSSVGFGDVTPVTELGRLSVIASLFIMLSVLPTQSQDLLRVINLRSTFARISYKKASRDVDHILLLGNTQTEGFKTFLGELYHADHGVTDTHTVIMQHNPPSEDMNFLLRMSNLQSKITYLEGNPIYARDLKRAAAETTKCVVILANKVSNNPMLHDYKNILQAFSVKQYVRMMVGREIRVCLQMLKPENKDLYFSSLGASDHDQVICVEELKLYLLAKTCLCPGINTIISFLITSNKPSYEQHKNLKDTWMDEYLLGMQNEIYRVPFDAKVFVGINFNVIAQHIYKSFGYILFALEITIMGETKVFLNPSEYIFRDMNHFGYVLADSLPDVERLKSFEFPDQVTRNFHFTSNNEKGKKFKGTGNSNITSENKRFRDEITEEKESKSKAFYYSKTGSVYNGINTISNIDENKFENHFIVCGIVPGMKHFLLPLRAKSLKSIQPVIILYNDPMPTEIWKQINRFPKVYFLQGSPLKLSDLEKACVQKAAAVVILSKHNENEDSNNTGMVDADTIFIYKTVKLLNPNIRIITELASISTISFLSLSRNQEIQKYGYIMSEPFASGEIYISTMLDTLICQAFYNPFITSILDQMIMGNANIKPHWKKIHSAMKIQQSNLFLIDLPPRFCDKKFGELFDTLALEHKMIAIGLYRGERVKGLSGKSQYNNSRPYVFVKPPPDIRIDQKDKVFVLCPKQPKEFEVLEEDEEKKNFNENDPFDYSIKSKLQGEEGRIDTEHSRELNKLSMEFKSIAKELQNVNEITFAKGLIQPVLVPKIREILRQELGSNIKETNIKD